MSETRVLRALDPKLFEVEDRLHEKTHFVENIYDLVTKKIEPPFALSIDGLWGSGKTMVMDLLQKKLSDENEKYPVVWFDPWEYQQAENVVYAFLKKLKDDLSDSSKESSRVLEILDNFLNIAINATSKRLFKLTISNFRQDIKEKQNESKKGFEKHEDLIEQAKKDFKELIDIYSKENKGLPVIVFFDDLDRCMPDDTINLLEALKNLFITKDTNCIFICGIDSRVVKQFIMKRYKVDETFAINYFRKIFNLTLSMPNPTDDIVGLLQENIEGLFKGTDYIEPAELSIAINKLGRMLNIFSLRNYINLLYNIYTFTLFHREYEFVSKYSEDPIINSLSLKESYQPLYEKLIDYLIQKEFKTEDGEVADTLINYKKELRLPYNLYEFANKFDKLMIKDQQGSCIFKNYLPIL